MQHWNLELLTISDRETKEDHQLLSPSSQLKVLSIFLNTNNICPRKYKPLLRATSLKGETKTNKKQKATTQTQATRAKE